MHAPEAPVLLVGTHKDELDDVPAALKQANDILTDFLGDIALTAILKRIKRPSDEEWFFPVDNTARKVTEGGKVRASDLSVGKIRMMLEQIVNEDKREVEGLYFALFTYDACAQREMISF